MQRSREQDVVLGRAVLRASADVPRDAPILVERGHLQLEATQVQAGGLATDPSPKSSDPAIAQLSDMTLKDAVEQTKRTMIVHAVNQNAGNWAAAARSLGMARSNLHHMARRLGIQK